MRRQRLCSIPAEAGPGPASSGPTLAMVGPGADRIRPAWPTSAPPTARPSAHLDGFKGVLQVDGYGGYLADVISRIVQGYPQSGIDQLPPWADRPFVAAEQISAHSPE